MPAVESIHAKLEGARRDLLDLTTRNRLISTSRSKGRSGRLEIVDELSDEVFRILVTDHKPMTFLPSDEGDEESDEDAAEPGVLFQPLEDESNVEGVAARHIDGHLQTRLSSESLQRRLLKLYYDARTFEEEQGVSTLYLALGFLRWYEDDKSDRERWAPLLLIPVELDRQSAAARFHLRYTDDEITTNLSLQEKLKVDFGIELPDIPEEVSPAGYFADVDKAVAGRARWQVMRNDMVLWFFSFAKFLMYRDLQPDMWPDERQIGRHPLITGLLADGFRPEPPICNESENVDRLLQPLDMIHVVDADSSQTIAIEEMRRGRNLVIQGPPGTGKSQTITNLIATAVKQGRKVLFVAEKMAALEVVKRRLDNISLGDMCLELHSHKANKKAVLEELAHTLDLGRPKANNVAAQAEELKTYRDKLNRHAEILHSYLEPARITPFQALGELVRLRAAGLRPADFQLIDALTWTATDVREKRAMLQDLAVHLGEVGNPRQHAWRGVEIEALLPADVDRVAATIPTILGRLDKLMATVNRLAELVHCGVADTLLECSKVARFGQRLTAAPPMDRHKIASTAWSEQRDAIDRLVDAGAALAESRQFLRGTVADVGWTTDLAATRQHLGAYGKSLFRLFYRAYREARAKLRGILLVEPPKTLDARLDILDRLIRGQKAYHAVEKDQRNQELGPMAFGSLWRGADSDWTALKRISQWEKECRNANVPDSFRQVLAKVTDLTLVDSLVKQVAEQLKPLLGELQQLFLQLKLNVAAAFETQDLRTVSLRQLRERLQAWKASPEAVTRWVSYFTRWRRLKAQGMEPLAERLDQGLVPAMQALDRFQMAYYEQLMREAWRRYPELSGFDGVSHEQLLSKFRQLDSERLAMARQEVALAHHQGLPTHGGEVGEVGILRHEMQKKRRHLPLRKLLQEAGHAIQAVKPVFMMSPISVAQYLQPGALEFDLLLIDEASQVRPVDALGALARVRQIVVVGDDRQLPPTRFFNRLVGEDDEATEADDFQAGDLESILGLCVAQNVPQRMLQWHYRSRHQSLIAVSNREFYDDRLFIVPSPFDGDGRLGLQFRYVSGGVFDRGGSATNRTEARAVATAVMQHASQCPDKTLGVGAFSVGQRDAILDELELLRRQAPDREPFFTTGAGEPFFVKNLENIQGDERDVVFISVGYGKDTSGYMAMSFGPLNNDGGERRLNVLITRARERCEVFSSITAEDIDLHRTNARGVQALKRFLAYTQNGFLDTGIPTDRSYGSEFEREVARAVAAHGYEVEPQVGVAGFFIDVAVIDPACPGRYLLGIECDGAMYHSSRSARDRDRLRQQVLEDRGWIIHRIWSTDWFNRPEEQLRKVLAAIDHAKAIWASRATDVKPELRELSSSRDSINREQSGTSGHPPLAVKTVPYVEADFVVDANSEIHELRVGQLANIVTKVVAIEGPVHQDEVARRVTALWGQRRTGTRIADAVETALAQAAYDGHIVQAGLFFRPAKQPDVPIRNRENVRSANLRKPEYLPPDEICAALVALIHAHLGVSRDEAVVEVARLLGFKSTGAQLRQVIQDEIDSLLQRQILSWKNEKVYPADLATATELR